MFALTSHSGAYAMCAAGTKHLQRSQSSAECLVKLSPQLQGEVRAAFDLVHRHCRRPNEPKKKKGRGGAKKKKKRAGRNGRKRLKNAFELLALHNITSDLLSSRHAVFQEQLRAHHERLQRRFEELKLTASEHDFAE